MNNSRSSIAICAFSAAMAASAFAGSINFETGAPSFFTGANALTSTYSGQGVTFSGPTTLNGGAILDQLSNFGINAHSGSDFLAFANSATLFTGGHPVGPETISFASPVTNVSLWVGGANTSPSYTLAAYDAGHNLLDTQSGSPVSQNWLQLSLNDANISSVVLTYTGTTAVVDDLSWNTSPVSSSTPEPSTLLLLGPGAVALLWTRRLKRKGF